MMARRRASRSWRGLAAVLVVGLTTPPAPEVTEIELVPSVVMVGTSSTDATSFVLEARLWTGPPSQRAGILESADLPLKWTVSPSTSWLQLVGNPEGHRATLRAAPGAPPSTPVVVTVEAGGKSAESRIIPATGSDQDDFSDEDVFKAGYTDDMPPSVAVVHGIRDAPADTCAVWLARALVRSGSAGRANAGCGDNDGGWNVAVLDPAHGLAIQPTNFTPGVDAVDLGAALPIRSIPVAVRVVVGGEGDLGLLRKSIQTFASTEIRDANAVLAESRVGIELKVAGDIEIVESPAIVGETEAADCLTGDEITAGFDHREVMLHVYFLNLTGGADAFTCAGTDGRPESVIYVKSNQHSATILVHEIGHALGLTVPGLGHSDDLPGFDAANAMASGYADTDDVWRRRFTVGQAVRMNVDSASWLNWANGASNAQLRPDTDPHPSCQCGADDPTGHCPRLIDDIARPRGGLGILYSWQCDDLVKLPANDPSEQPVALIAGRRWRAPPNECSRDIVGGREVHFSAMYVEFDNLTRQGKCPSWVAVFFRRHGPLFAFLDASSGEWTDVAEQRVWPGGYRQLPALATVPVDVYYPPSDDSEVTLGIDEALRVFGEENLTGIELQFLRHPDLPAPCPAAPAGGLSICYSAAGATISQLVAAALHLPAVTALDQGNAAFSSNLMQTALSDRGERLTLGQVFRIHSALGTADFPDCDLQPTLCPPIGADVKP